MNVFIECKLSDIYCLCAFECAFIPFACCDDRPDESIRIWGLSVPSFHSETALVKVELENGSVLSVSVLYLDDTFVSPFDLTRV